MDGMRPQNSVLIYDDDHYYMGSVIAEQLVAEGFEVYFATPHPEVASWTNYTLEQHRIQSRLLELGVKIITSHEVRAMTRDSVELGCVYSGQRQTLAASSVVMITSRIPEDSLFRDLNANTDQLRRAGIETLKQIGDCHGPATIAAAVYEGHRFARELGEEVADIPFRRELTELSSAFELP
jgi:dimethylamine/trimethylamine dehydrogenase